MRSINRTCCLCSITSWGTMLHKLYCTKTIHKTYTDKRSYCQTVATFKKKKIVIGCSNNKGKLHTFSRAKVMAVFPPILWPMTTGRWSSNWPIRSLRSCAITGKSIRPEWPLFPWLRQSKVITLKGERWTLSTCFQDHIFFKFQKISILYKI